MDWDEDYGDEDMDWFPSPDEPIPSDPLARMRRIYRDLAGRNPPPISRGERAAWGRGGSGRMEVYDRYRSSLHHTQQAPFRRALQEAGLLGEVIG